MTNTINRIWGKPNSQLLSFKNEYQILHWMDFIKYGWLDKYYKKHIAYDDEWFNYYELMLPQDTIKYKIGTCYEQSLLAYWLFVNNFSYECHLYHIEQVDVSSHLFLMYEKNNIFYHFEHSFERFKGIHGPYKSKEEIILSVIDKMEQVDETGEYGIYQMDINPLILNKRISAKEIFKMWYKFGKQ